MAGVFNHRKKSRSTDESFMNKPCSGWLHAADMLSSDRGVQYTIRYMGSIPVVQSMKLLDFQTRTALTKECISMVLQSTGVTSNYKLPAKFAKIRSMIGTEVDRSFQNNAVNLLINTDRLLVNDLITNQVIAVHDIPGVSFASGGDTDTQNFVAYVVKPMGGSSSNSTPSTPSTPTSASSPSEVGRACHVYECGYGLAHDVITTLGQAFHLRYNNYIDKTKTLVAVNSQASITTSLDDNWNDDYYNDRPGAQPPLEDEHATNTTLTSLRDDIPPGYSVVMQSQHRQQQQQQQQQQPCTTTTTDYVNTNNNEVCYTNDLKVMLRSPSPEPWFHGQISRASCSNLLKQYGDFLVRESNTSNANSGKQYVLSSKLTDHRIKHLLLVDPFGIVRTKDHKFESITELIDYHCQNCIPIISIDCEIQLRTPIFRTVDQ